MMTNLSREANEKDKRGGTLILIPGLRDEDLVTLVYALTSMEIVRSNIMIIVDTNSYLYS